MKNILPLYITIALLLTSFFASCGEDRSGEQPFAPTVKTVSTIVEADSATLIGEVVASPNSSLKECGFSYGNESIQATCKAPEAVTTFQAVTSSLNKGTYYAVAYATNGMGTTYGDTIYFTIE